MNEQEKNYDLKVEDLTSKIAGKSTAIIRMQSEFEKLIVKIVDSAPADRERLKAERIGLREDLDLARAEHAELQRRLTILRARPPAPTVVYNKNLKEWERE
jgi:hypothetical protein